MADFDVEASTHPDLLLMRGAIQRGLERCGVSPRMGSFEGPIRERPADIDDGGDTPAPGAMAHALVDTGGCKIPMKARASRGLRDALRCLQS